MRALLPLLLVLAACSGDGPLLILTVDGEIAGARLLRAALSLDGRPIGRAEEFPGPSVGLRFPPGTAGTIAVDVEALDRDGCASGGGRGVVQLGADPFPRLAVTLSRLDPRRCAASALTVGAGGDDAATAVAALPDGGAVLVGAFSGTLALGGEPLRSQGGRDAFVLRLGPDGVPRWARRMGGAGDDRAKAVAVAADGDLVVAGTYSGAVELCGQAAPDTGTDDVFLLRLSPDGDCRFARTAAGTGADAVEGVTLDRQGRIVIAGSFTGALSLSGAPGPRQIVADSLGVDAFAAQYDGAGELLWAVPEGGPRRDEAYGVVTDANDGVLLVGSAENEEGGRDGFVLRLRADSGLSWRRPLGGGAGQAGATRVAVDAAGDVIVAGLFQGAIDLAGHPLAAASTGTDGFVARFRAGNGAVDWARAFGGAGDDAAWGLALDAQDGVVLCGYFQYRVAFDGADRALTARGNLDIFAARYSAAGALLWARGIGGTDDDRCWGVALGAGGPLLAADFRGRLEGATASTPESRGGGDALLLRLAP